MVSLTLIIMLGVLEGRHVGNQSGDNKIKYFSQENRLPERKVDLIESTETLLESILKEEMKLNNQRLQQNEEKRSPRCLLWCLRRKILHPAQCHAYC